MSSRLFYSDLQERFRRFNFTAASVGSPWRCIRRVPWPSLGPRESADGVGVCARSRGVRSLPSRKDPVQQVRDTGAPIRCIPPVRYVSARASQGRRDTAWAWRPVALGALPTPLKAPCTQRWCARVMFRWDASRRGSFAVCTISEARSGRRTHCLGLSAYLSVTGAPTLELGHVQLFASILAPRVKGVSLGGGARPRLARCATCNRSGVPQHSWTRELPAM